METKNITMDELLEIEVLLEEASAWGLRNEVETTAKGYITDGHAPLDAYHFAYEDWIK